MSNETVDFWNIVADPVDLTELRVGDLVGVEETRDGKPWRRRVIVVTEVEEREDGERAIQFRNAPWVTEFPSIVIVTGNRAEDTQ